MAPHVVAQAVKSACLCSAVFEALGFAVCPGANDARGDIITSVKFGKADFVDCILSRNSEGCAGGFVCRATAVGYARLCRPGDYGGGRVCTGGVD